MTGHVTRMILPLESSALVAGDEGRLSTDACFLFCFWLSRGAFQKNMVICLD
jgi:hypothetical protein